MEGDVSVFRIAIRTKTGVSHDPLRIELIEGINRERDGVEVRGNQIRVGRVGKDFEYW